MICMDPVSFLLGSGVYVLGTQIMLSKTTFRRTKRRLGEQDAVRALCLLDELCFADAMTFSKEDLGMLTITNASSIKLWRW